MTDSLAPEAVEPLLTGRFGRPYTYVDTCESTQLLLGPEAPEGAVAVADEQVAGRGRQGRAWHAPAGTSLLCSIALRPAHDEGQSPNTVGGLSPAQVTLVGAVAAAQAIEDTADLSVQIKWPNDVMLDRRKVAGVLGELRDGLVVLGLGVNVNQGPGDLPTATRVAPGSLRSITGQTFARASLLASLLARLEHAYDAWRGGGLGAIYTEIGPRDFLRGRVVSVDKTHGVAVAITRDGSLEIDAERGERIVVTSGEISFER